MARTVWSFAILQDSKLMENRIELTINKLTADTVTSLRAMQKQIDKQTWQIIGALYVMMALALAGAKFL